MSLSNNIISQMNKLASSGVWLLLLEVVVSDSVTLYFVNNPDPIVFGGNTYSSFPFQIEDTKQSSKGDIPTIRLQVSNVTRYIQSYLETYNGGVGFVINLKIVNSEFLAENYADFNMTFDVLSSESDVEWATFTLGAPSPLRERFPKDRYLSRYCRFTFKLVECGYSGAYETCARHLDDCRVRENSVRFGGFPGLANRTMRVV